MKPEPNISDEILNLSACDDDVDVAQIKELLPVWKTHILEANIVDKEDFPKLSLRFLLNAQNVEEIQKWLTQLQERNKTTYSIYSTAKSAGKYVHFKQRLVCHHKTKSKNVYNPTVKSVTNTKNTNCPSKMTIVLHAIKKRSKRKDAEKVALLRNMPCEVTFISTHNHPTSTPDTLKFRKMSNEVKERLLQLFRDGHTPSSALELIKAHLTLNNENHEEILADRKYCPTYQDCYQLYRKEFGRVPCKSSQSRKRKMVAQDEPVVSKIEPLVKSEPISYEIEVDNEDDDDDDDDDVSYPEEMREKARWILARINAQFLSFVDLAPMEMLTGLEALHETLKTVESPAVCVSHCLSFGSGVERKHNLSYKSLQSVKEN